MKNSTWQIKFFLIPTHTTLLSAAFFLWLEVKNDEQAAIKLWTQSGIRVLPGSYLSRDTVMGNPGENFIRVALVEKIDEVTRGLNAIREIIYN
jgi:aspartate/methionine/tyrosine aminotransferase